MIANDTSSNHDIIIGILTLGAMLLKRQYDLSDEELEDLFIFEFGSPDESQQSIEMVESITNLVRGKTGPKR